LRGFPAGRKGSKKVRGTFLPAGKVQKNFAGLSCRQEKFKKVLRDFPVGRKGSEKVFLAFSIARRTPKKVKQPSRAL
jgi:hypothetical protein